MFDDLDPDFMSSPGAALPLVAARVHAVRRRRQVIVASVVGAGVIVLLGSMAFGSGGKPDRLTVAKEVTTTTDDTSTTEAPLITAPTSTATSTTAAATSTTATLPAVVTSTSEPTTTTTVPRPAHLVVSFDRDRLVIQSGTSMKIEATVTNDGGRPGRFGYPKPDCAPFELWPDEQSFAYPIAWPAPAAFAPRCLALSMVEVAPGESATVPVNIDSRVAATNTGSFLGNYMPIPPGHDTLELNNQLGAGEGRLPVTITPPDTLPLTIDHPSEVTTASDAQNSVDFTITNNLRFAVTYFDQGPCVHGGEEDCVATAPHSARDLRRRPYDKADRPLWRTRFVLGAHETRTVSAAVDGVIDLDNSDSNGPDLPPGVYHFFWDGEKVKFTVTP